MAARDRRRFRRRVSHVPNFFKGGFVGVDIFFVISGYLISGIIVDAVERNRFSYLDFYIRRINEFFRRWSLSSPPAFVGWYVLLPDEFERLGKHLAAGAGLATNLVLWGEAAISTYRATPNHCCIYGRWPSKSNSTFLWPLILGPVWRRKRGLLVATASSAAISFAYNVISVVHHPVAAFYFARWRDSGS